MTPNRKEFKIDIVSDCKIVVDFGNNQELYQNKDVKNVGSVSFENNEPDIDFNELFEENGRNKNIYKQAIDSLKAIK